MNCVFIHRSIKTRIETYIYRIKNKGDQRFLYIDPLKQGLKREKTSDSQAKEFGFYT